MHRLVRRVGLIEGIDHRLCLLKVHLPYHGSDHVLNIVGNRQAGKPYHENREVRRNNRVYLAPRARRTSPIPKQPATSAASKQPRC